MKELSRRMKGGETVSDIFTPDVLKCLLCCVTALVIYYWKTH